MFDSEYSAVIRIGAIIKIPEILRLVPNHLKPKKICKNAVKKLPFIVRYGPGQYVTKQMCDKVNLEIGGTIESVPD